MDGENWTELDARTGNTDLNAKEAVMVFELATIQESRWIRLRMTGPNHRA
jgi:hypothetical protein